MQYALCCSALTKKRFSAMPNSFYQMVFKTSIHRKSQKIIITLTYITTGWLFTAGVRRVVWCLNGTQSPSSQLIVHLRPQWNQFNRLENQLSCLAGAPMFSVPRLFPSESQGGKKGLTVICGRGLNGGKLFCLLSKQDWLTHRNLSHGWSGTKLP